MNSTTCIISGTDKRTIFQSSDDYKRFQDSLYLSNTRENINVRDRLKGVCNPYSIERNNPLVAIGTYCLMPNHFHLLATPLYENGVSLFLQKLLTSYSMYFNQKYERTGGLFEGKFKSQLADDGYLKYLFSYIHLNPVKLIQSDWKERGVEYVDVSYDFVSDYQHSSLPAYLGVDRPENKILDKQAFPNYSNDYEDIKTELFEWLKYKNNENDLLGANVPRVAIGAYYSVA
ncbi:transposase [Candidatus Kaiserbacteria bacterium]|nr:transposase [Candidatus Kaiserbacteria bacterium]